MSIAELPTEQRLVLDDVDWRSYSRLLRTFENRPSVRLTYNRGLLQIITISHEHESYGRFLGRMVVTLTEELNLPIKEGGSTTFRRRRRKRGLEADNSYWIASEPLVRGKLQIDLKTDPPPDLGIEIDISHSSIDRLEIYAKLNVSEIWRFDGTVLTFYVLGSNGRYAVNKFSRAFPKLKADDLVPFLMRREQRDENAVIREFREWIRGHLCKT